MKSGPLITYRRKPASLDASELESFAEVLRAQVARGREFHCRIANDAELRALNAQFRAKDYPADVLSFPHRPLPYGRVSATIDFPRRDRKGADDVPLGTGLDHETDSGRMKRAELRWRKKLGLPVGLIERVA